MKIISFAWTTDALLAGRKTVTRRSWDPDYAKRFSAGELVQAYDRSPRHKGKCVATIRILSVTWEPDANAPDDDYEAEGFDYLVDRWHGDLAAKILSEGQHPGEDERIWKAEQRLIERGLRWQDFEAWRRRGGWSWVVRFELVEVMS